MEFIRSEQYFTGNNIDDAIMIDVADNLLKAALSLDDCRMLGKQIPSELDGLGLKHVSGMLGLLNHVLTPENLEFYFRKKRSHLQSCLPVLKREIKAHGDQIRINKLHKRPA